MPEHRDDPPPEPPTDRLRADAKRFREIERRAPPLPDPKPTFPVDPPFTAALADLSGLWLDVRCTCGQHAALPLRRLAAEWGWRTTLAAALPRLKCARCGASPTTVDLVDDPAAGASGTPGRPADRMKLIEPPCRS